MRVLLINAFDKIPGENFRDQRYTILFDKLKEKADVQWLSADFHHWSHSRRNPDCVDASGIELLHVPAYEKNISLIRFYSHFVFSFKVLLRLIRLRQKPDVVLTIAPVENLFFVTIYCKIRRIKVVVDVLDLWPDIFVEAFPGRIKKLGTVLVAPLHLLANISYTLADHITSVSRSYTDMALSRSFCRKKSSDYFYLGSPDLGQPDYSLRSHNQLNCLFAGQFEFNYDIDSILAVALRAKNEQIDVHFYLAGSGSKLPAIQRFITENSLGNVTLTGWLSSTELMNVASKCHIGLNCYKNHATQSIPTKYFDYMSMGLLVVNSLSGEMYDLVNSDRSGYNYESENVDSLFNVVQVCMANMEDVFRTGNSNRSEFVNRYSSSAIYDRMAQMLLEIGNA